MKFGLQRGWGGNRRSLPYLVLFLSLAATVCAWVWAGLIVGSKDNERFAYATEEAELAIKGRVGDQVDLLRSSAATFALQGGWTRSQFHAYVQNLGLGTNFRGSQGIGFIRRVRKSDIPSFERSVRAEGVTDYTVHPPTNDQEAFPIVYLEPETRANAPSIGYDGDSEPVRRAALSAARDTGQPTISGVVATPANRNGARQQSGFILYCPIYHGGKTPSVAEERRKLLVGFVYSRFRGSDVFRDVLEGESRRDLDVEIFDRVGGKPPERFYVSSRAASIRPSRIVFDGVIPVLGRQWLIRYHSSNDFEQQSAAWLVNWIAIAGLVVSGLLAAVSFSQVRAYGQLNDQAGVVVRREAHQRLLANVGASLVEAGASDQNFHAVGRLAVEEFVDWFSIYVLANKNTPPAIASELTAASYVTDDPACVFRDAGFSEWLVKQRVPTLFELSGFVEPELRPLQSSWIHSIAVLPLVNRQSLVGAIVVGRGQKGFDDDDIHLLEQIASRTVVAIDSGRLFQEKEIELEERKKVEAQVRRLNENLELIVEERTTELQATNKELEAFCYSVSHDLRAPLRSVDGFSKSLLEDYKDQLDEGAKDYIARVRNASHRMDELISALLNLSRITRLEIVRQPIDLSQIARVTIEDALEGRDRAKYEITVRPGMRAEADPKLIRVVFDNLIRNAIKFSGPLPVSKIEVGLQGAAFFVRDNGVGFNPAYAEKLFVAFERLHSQREFPGSGIGLATVQRIIQKHGGTVWAESEEGKGATFFFTLR